MRRVSHLSQLLSGQLPVGLGPLHLARVTLHLEVLVALGPAELEDLRKDRMQPQAEPRICSQHALWRSHACILRYPMCHMPRQTVSTARFVTQHCLEGSGFG